MRGCGDNIWMMFPEQQKVGVPGEDRDEDDDESHVEHEYDRQHHRLHTAGGIIHKHSVI